MTHADKENNPEYLLRAVVVHHGKYFSSGTDLVDYSLESITVVPSNYSHKEKVRYLKMFLKIRPKVTIQHFVGLTTKIERITILAGSSTTIPRCTRPRREMSSPPRPICYSM